MFTSHLIRQTHVSALGTLMAVALTMVSATRAEAQTIRTSSEAACQTVGSVQDQSHSNPAIETRTNGGRRVVCPIVRVNPAMGWLGVQVNVRDRHSV